MMGKTVLDEEHPQFIGLYEGDRSRAYVIHRVETADCVLHLGALMTDFNTGGFTANVEPKRSIIAQNNGITIKHHRFDKVPMKDFIEG